MKATTKEQVLYLSYDGLTDPLGQSQILPYLCGLSKEYAITIISFEKKDKYENDNTLIESICNSYSLNWVPLRYYKRPPVVSTLYNLWKLKNKVKKLHQKNQYRIIHCRSYIPSLIGLWMKKAYGLQFIFDMRGFWADERVEGGLWNLKNPLYRIIYNFFKKNEKYFLIHSDEIISLTKMPSEK